MNRSPVTEHHWFNSKTDALLFIMSAGQCFVEYFKSKTQYCVIIRTKE